MSSPRVALTILPPLSPRMPPSGPGVLQSYLEPAGYEVDIIDLNNIFYSLAGGGLKKEWGLSCNTGLEDGIFSLIKEEFPDRYNSVFRRLLEYDVVGFSCFKSNLKSTLLLAGELRRAGKNIKVALGGPEIARQYFSNGGSFGAELSSCADLLVAGEGELPLLAFLRGEESGTALFREMENLDDLPFPSYRGVDLAAYPRKGALPVQFSRGCVRKCAFCSERLLFKGFRTRRPGSVISELRYHRKKSGIDSCVFTDSMLNADPGKLSELCRAINGDFGRLDWEAQIGVSPACGDELFSLMKESGCYNLFIGLESGCDRVLEKMRKGFTSAQALEFFSGLKRAGLSYGVSIITGYPGETEEDFREGLDFILGHRDLIPKIEQVNPFVYYEGTDADRAADYRSSAVSLRRMEDFVREIKLRGFKYTNAFLGNLLEK